MSDAGREIELKPCPFCGGKAAIQPNVEDSEGGYFVVCLGEDCFCVLGEHYYREVDNHDFDEKEDAAEAWNKRVALRAVSREEGA